METQSHSSETVIIDLGVKDDRCSFSAGFASAIDKARIDLESIENQIAETEETLAKLTPNCDKLDYALAASSGILCGIIDIFLVGKPGESPLGKTTDKAFEGFVKIFARLHGWKGNEAASAIKFLEDKYYVPYDQTGIRDAAKDVLGLNPSNHHFKSLAHNPTLLGLFMSICNQWFNTSDFVTGGDLATIYNASDKFVLNGKTNAGKLFFGFKNWFGHLMSDISGSSGTVKKGNRGTGIPTPIWSWSNDVIAIKKKLMENGLITSITDFDRAYNELALEIFKQGYDVRFQTAQTIPVLVNELVVRMMYATRRLITYFTTVPKEERSFKRMWKVCEPFTNPSVKRMLTVAHGVFFVADLTDAVGRAFVAGGGNFNVVEFFLRLNIPGIGRFGISLFGEIKRLDKRHFTKIDLEFYKREKNLTEDYIKGLEELAVFYDDSELLDFIYDLKDSNLYKEAFDKSIELAMKRSVQEDKILKNKTEIDAYFLGGTASGKK